MAAAALSLQQQLAATAGVFLGFGATVSCVSAAGARWSGSEAPPKVPPNARSAVPAARPVLASKAPSKVVAAGLHFQVREWYTGRPRCSHGLRETAPVDHAARPCVA
jgi:hypothetical protein